MTGRLSSRDERALRIGGIAVGALCLVMFGMRPLASTLRELSGSVAVEREMLTRELEIVAAEPYYMEALEDGGERLLAAAPRLFGGETNGVAAAYVAEYVQDAARASRSLITRFEPDGVEPVADGVESLSGTVHGESDLQGLLTLLYLLEGGEKLLHITDLRITATRGLSRVSADMEVISFEFGVTGYQLIPFAPLAARARIGSAALPESGS